MLDIHSHILPGIDDGSKDIDTTLEMLRIAKSDGIDKIIATPHFYKFNYENSYSDVVELIKKVSERAKDKNIDIEILPGQEVYLDKFTLDLYNNGNIGTLNNSQYMLVELQPSKLEPHILDIIYELRVKGITPIIAHPERYVFVHNNLSSLNDFIREGCLFQINTGSIAGIYGKKLKRITKKLLDKNICDFIATDAHSIGVRKPQMNKILMNSLKSYRHIGEIVERNCRLLLNDSTIICNRELIIENKRYFWLNKK
ncbi:exopolysaccharide biosynthesis protein [Clostridium sediminicola]|uniref:tyrosine-protein phosphatase n=1 Tax=Clostridium sediminicola TaxID=3114879 RepID=UPI0031F209B9